ncbi:MAG: DUF3084 domain-containing protein [Armatimonadota bacterium]
MSGLLFLALLMVVVSGLIAYIGDLIGRKMGRKRLTLFGLRPRYTAIVISVAAGMIIALCTIAAALILSKDIRDSFIKPRAALQKEIEQLQGQLETEKDSLRELQLQYTDAQKQLQDAQKRVAGFSSVLASHEKKLSDKKKQLAEVEVKLKHAEASLNESKKKLQQYDAKLVSEGRKVAQYGQDIVRLKEERTELQSTIATMRDYVEYNFKDLAYARGQEILTGLMPTTRESLETRRVSLRCFLDTAERMVHQQCNELAKDQTAIVYLQVVNGKTVIISGEKAVEIMSNRLANLAAAAPKAIVRLAPENNVAVNGQAFINVNAVQILPNTKVFNSGEEVARLNLTVTAQTGSGEILTRLVDGLLRENVPSALRKKELLLILRRFDPAFPSELPGASPSLVSWSDLANAAEQVKKYSGKVSIIARSSKTMNRFDSLDLTLEVIGSD